MSEVPQFVTAILNDIARSEGFVDFAFELKPGCKHGDNFLGVITSVLVSGQRKVNGTVIANDKLNLICKLQPTDEFRKREFQSNALFTREILLYNKILPIFAEFQQEKGLTGADAFTAYPKCYAAIADEETDQFVVIMEDLKPKQFAMWPKEKSIAVDHAYLIVEQLAKLHAVSFALRNQRPDEYKCLNKLDDLFQNFFKTEGMMRLMEAGFDRAIKALINEKHIKVMQELKVTAMPTIKQLWAIDAGEPYSVLGHGDFWINNLLFQYKNETKVASDICFLDWQMACYGSPVLDLHHILFTSTDKELRDKEYENLIKHYHKTLATNINKLGSDAETVYPWKIFKNDLRKFGKASFIIVVLMIQLILAKSEDIPDMDELSRRTVNNEENVDIITGLDDETQLIYNKRVNDVVGDLIDLEYHNYEFNN